MGREEKERIREKIWETQSLNECAKENNKGWYKVRVEHWKWCNKDEKRNYPKTLSQCEIE